MKSKQLLLISSLAVVAAGVYYLFGKKNVKRVADVNDRPAIRQDHTSKIRAVMHHAKELAV